MAKPELAERVERIEAHLAIQQLAIRYAMAVDARDIDAWVACFRPDPLADLVAGPGEQAAQGLLGMPVGAGRPGGRSLLGHLYFCYGVEHQER